MSPHDEDELGRETASVRGRDPVRFETIGSKRRTTRAAAKRSSRTAPRKARAETIGFAM